MPWAERNLMSLRAEFVQLAKTRLIRMTALCRRFADGLQVAAAVCGGWRGRAGRPLAAAASAAAARPCRDARIRGHRAAPASDLGGADVAVAR